MAQRKRSPKSSHGEIQCTVLPKPDMSTFVISRFKLLEPRVPSIRLSQVMRAVNELSKLMKYLGIKRLHEGVCIHMPWNYQ